MYFAGRRLEEHQVPSILQGRDVAVEGLPVVGDDGHAAAGAEFLWDILALQGGGIRIPADGLVRLGLGQGLQEADAVAAGVEAVEVVEDDRLVWVAPEETKIRPLKVIGMDLKRECR